MKISQNGYNALEVEELKDLKIVVLCKYFRQNLIVLVLVLVICSAI